ncbi:polyhydroxyalkanoate synthesis repressor PhaR [Variovorax sp. NFACC28]|nr:polyhydroxyalkanoate synthesis repressor PhaR [Variovorax sp. NFACC28]SEG82671.1 polyhydroxyalkanoate synthesis repressor PhaR [Variovorax sp. NFACC29]SFD06894.1 polyhydroxyalkanoate synthesis repressor PhaR [Variovorax sp. NFACC26]SFG20377.1 polyhydroxyalkanoate synthesis repressor PhaR [Variovorax sp. NFACC27]
MRRGVRNIGRLRKVPQPVRVNLVATQQNRSLESSDDMGVHVKESAVQSKKSGAKPVQRVIKKYPNRRLYDTETSTYITLTEVKQLVIQNAQFVVRDAKTGDDLTRSILLQIILEEEAGGAPMFTEQVLANIIRFYGQAMQGYMGPYLEKNIQAMTEVQAQLAEKAEGLTPEMWARFMTMQSPMLQGLMGSYVEQSKNVFLQMQEQMQKNTEQVLGAFGIKRS